ncbi:MAG: FHA domain-containing protein [Chloroflexota bacterium]
MMTSQPTLDQPDLSRLPHFMMSSKETPSAQPPVDSGGWDNAMIVMYNVEQERKCWSLNRTRPVTIGRSEHCDIVLDDRQASRYHARITWQDEYYCVEDLGSKNGTHVNGEQYHQSVALNDGDELQIGLKSRLMFVDDGATAPLTVAPNQSGLSIDHDARSIWVNQTLLDPPLSLPQYQLIIKLWESEGKIVSRDEIVDAVWPDESFDGISEQAIDALIRRLRERIAEVDSENQYIVTVRGHGFRLDHRAL